MRATAGRRRWWAARPGEWAFAVLGLPPALLGGAYALAALYAGVLLSLTVVGLPVAAAALTGARALGRPHRRLTARLLGTDVPDPGHPVRPPGVVAAIRSALTDPVAWRTLGYLLLRLPLGVLGAAAVLLPLGALWLLGFPLWLRLLEDGPHPAGPLDLLAPPLGLAVLAAIGPAVRLLAEADRRLARHLLGPARTQQRVRDLEAARHTLLSTGTDRLRRLERDLHDGTQARLVAVALTLALADDTLADPHPDPDRLRTLVDRARTQTDRTIAELRVLTRGLRPPGLDGGLDDALPALAAGCAVPVTLRLDLPQRPDEAIEQAVWYCAAELLTNISRHSAARTAELTVSGTRDLVRLTVRDDGRGGAAPTTLGTGGGTGLAGLAERLAAVDGRLRIDSPPGGPTTVTAELPTRL
ncbi:sensor histidine kinase [Kitasatospora cineracea]|uniref:histidine kinase n=1 Tax=Kitasatospora cineracea TaxID=88074 RepID=A0A8G1US33_9ACTN|nr:sensor domain-containing protein [Kitasatospora cineracea]ROR46772.1 signal transduction histidine kinase [Kitasatospora cineracea]